MTDESNLHPTPYGSPVVGYIRSPQRNDPTLDEAETRIRAYCTQHGWNLAKIFREEGVSSVASWRPQFEEMIKGLERRKWVGVILAGSAHLSVRPSMANRLRRQIELWVPITVIPHK